MTIDRIFLDANIFFSIAYGSPGLNRLAEFAKRKYCALFGSEYVIKEARRNLFQREQLRRLEAFLTQVQIAPEVDPRMPGPILLPEKDKPVFLAAISIKADFLLTGDTIHFGKYFGQTVSGVTIYRPRDYMNLLQRRTKTK
jgi:predicted nucleic acid-binding protein